MASLQIRKRKGSASYLIQFMIYQERRTVYLGNRYSQEDAEEISGIVEKLARCKEVEEPPSRKIAAWLANITDDLRDRLVSCGLLERKTNLSIQDVINEYINYIISSGFSERTIKVVQNSLKIFEGFADFSIPITSFTKRDAQHYHEFLLSLHYAPATVSTFIRDVKRVFNYAVREEYLDKTPFVYVPTGTMQNKEREYFVDRDSFEEILSCAESRELRLALVLYRYGGLRRQEALLLNWSDVNFRTLRITVKSPKTKRHGKSVRVIPMFNELFKELVAYYNERQPRPDCPVVPLSDKSVEKGVERAIKRSGVTQYPRPIQNLRSSRSIEIFKEFGEVAENAWLGHTIAVAKSHYLHVTDQDFNIAVRNVGEMSVVAKVVAQNREIT